MHLHNSPAESDGRVTGQRPVLCFNQVHCVVCRARSFVAGPVSPRTSAAAHPDPTRPRLTMDNQPGSSEDKDRRTDSSGKGGRFGAIGEERYGTIPIGYDRGFGRGRTTQRNGSPVGRTAPLPGLGMGIGM